MESADAEEWTVIASIRSRKVAPSSSSMTTKHTGGAVLRPRAARSEISMSRMTSFAGQQSTFLNVVGAENVVRAVQACWASLFEGRFGEAVRTHMLFRVAGRFVNDLGATISAGARSAPHLPEHRSLDDVIHAAGRRAERATL